MCVGAYRVTQTIDTYIDVNSVKDLHSYTITNDQLVVGANMTLNKAIDLFNNVATNNTANFAYLKQVAYHISLVANVSVRNVSKAFCILKVTVDKRSFKRIYFFLDWNLSRKFVY